VRQVLALVVAGSPAVEGRPLNAGFEGRGFPELKRLRRLHVIVSVYHIVRPLDSAVSRRPGDNDRMPIGGTNPGVQPYAPTVIREPPGTTLQVRTVRFLGGNAWKANICGQFINKALLIGLQILEDRFHASSIVKARRFEKQFGENSLLLWAQ
jgi:hypothetical protein